MHVAELLRRCAGIQALSSLSAQLLFFVARRLESRIVQRSAGGATQSQRFFSFQTATIAVGDSDLDEKLYAYVARCKLEGQRHLFVGVATDKAAVCGQSLQNTTMTFGNNMTLVCCPQVASGTVGSDPGGSAQGHGRTGVYRSFWGAQVWGASSARKLLDRCICIFCCCPGVRNLYIYTGPASGGRLRRNSLV